ncbi:hypothetical protein ACFL4X_01045 [Gemmatimonadota bacterium]
MPSVYFEHEVIKTDASYRQVIGFLLKQLLRHRLILLLVLAAALVAALSEMMSIALFVPFLESLGDG